MRETTSPPIVPWTDEFSSVDEEFTEDDRRIVSSYASPVCRISGLIYYISKTLYYVLWDECD